MSEDGISYLDMGDAFLRGDFEMAVNSVWSPLYALILGTALRVTRPGMEWEFAVVHLTNLLLFVLALACFEFYWKRLSSPPGLEGGASDEDAAALSTERASTRLPWWAWWSIGYGLFIWVTLSLVRLWAVTPDMLVVALVFLGAGLVLRLETSPRERTHANMIGIALGATLGVGYLAKAVMLPVAVVFLGVTGLLARRDHRLRAPAGLAAMALVLIAGAWVVELSAANDRVTAGDIGRLAYVRHVNGVAYPFWKPGVEGTGEPDHPPRLVSREPAAYEFATPVPGTYPLSYDPSYWYHGLEPHIGFRDQVQALLSAGFLYADLFGRELGGVLAAVITLLILRRRPPQRPYRPAAVVGPAALAVVGLATLVLYAMVYVEGRYIAPFVVLIFGGLLHAARLPREPANRRVMAAAGAVMILFLVFAIGSFNVEGFLKFAGRGESMGRAAAWTDGVSATSDAGSTSPKGSGHLQAAVALRAQGVRPGEEIAFVGYAFGAYFARLARVRITRQIPDEAAPEFWNLDSSSFDRLSRTLLAGESKAIVTDWRPSGPSADRWSRLGASPYWVFRPPRPFPVEKEAHEPHE